MDDTGAGGRRMVGEHGMGRVLEQRGQRAGGREGGWRAATRGHSEQMPYLLALDYRLRGGKYGRGGSG